MHRDTATLFQISDKLVYVSIRQTQQHNIKQDVISSIRTAGYEYVHQAKHLSIKILVCSFPPKTRSTNMCNSTSPAKTALRKEGPIALISVSYASYKNLGMA